MILQAPEKDLPTLLGKNPVWDKFIEARLKRTPVELIQKPKVPEDDEEVPPNGPCQKEMNE